MPDNISRSSGRVSIDSSVHDLYKQLAAGKSVEDSPFTTMKDLFMLAVYAGYTSGERRPLSKKEQPFHYSVFSEKEDVPLLKAIAIASTGDIQILEDFGKVVEIAEEFANYGISFVYGYLSEQGGEALWNLTALLRDLKKVSDAP